MASPTVFDDCQTLGRQNSREFGYHQFQALQISFMLAATGHARYTDRKSARLRRNVFIMAPKGTGKSELLENIFPVGLCGARRLGDVSGESDHRPFPDGPEVYLYGGDSTQERIRGGISPSGLVIPPVGKMFDIVVCSEFTTIGGTRHDEVRKTAYWLNKQLEEGRGTNSLVRYFDLPDKAVQKIVAECQRLGITFDTAQRALCYDVAATFWFATHPISDEKTLQVYEECGLLDRCDVVVTDPSDDVLRDAKRGGLFGKMDPRVLQRVRAFNHLLWRSAFESIDYPPDWAMAEMRAFYHAAYDTIHYDTSTPYGTVSSGRDELDMAQLLTAACLWRTVSSRASPKDPAPVFRHLVYNQADVALAKQLAASILARLYAKHQDHVKEDPHSELAERELVQMLRALHEDDRVEFSRAQFRERLAAVSPAKKASAATVSRRLKALRLAGRIRNQPKKAGWFYVDDAFLVGLGLAPHEVERRHREATVGAEAAGDHRDDADPDDHHWRAEEGLEEVKT